MHQPDSLKDEVARLAAQLAFVQQTSAETITLLKEENQWLKAQLFGRSSEKTPRDEVSPDQHHLFNEAEAIANREPATETVTVPAYERSRRRGKTVPPELPRIEVLHDLPEDQKVCAHDGTRLERIGEETAEQLDYIPATVRVLRHVRPKYACPHCREGVKIAPRPPQILPKSLASPALLAQVTTAKYVDGLPLHRQERQFSRLGIELSRATMATWMVKLGQAVTPLINLLNEQLREAPLVHCDETPLQVLKSEKAATSKHWIWVRAAGPPGRRIVLYDHDISRGGCVPQRLFEAYRGILLTDGYEAYESIAKALGLMHAGCWVHARRKFDEARKASAISSARSRLALYYIGKLYGIEREIKGLTPEERLRVRRQKSAPIVSDFNSWLESTANDVLPQGVLGKAISYTLGQWPKLVRFLEHGEIPLDNNRCENAIRPFVVGRKAWLFSDTVAGAASSANLYSLVETAKANGLEPHAYFSHLFTELPKATAVEHFESLLPWNAKLALHLPR